MTENSSHDPSEHLFQEFKYQSRRRSLYSRMGRKPFIIFLDKCRQQNDVSPIYVKYTQPVLISLIADKKHFDA